jgi:hypothetical protein
MDPFVEKEYECEYFLFKNEPFYIGKGKLDRLTEHLKLKSNSNKNIKKKNRIKSIFDNGKEPIILKIKENLSEREALDIENKIINEIGREDLNKGPLLNLNDGGQLTQINYRHTQETKDKMSLKSKGKFYVNYILISPVGEKFENMCLTEFCKNNKLNYHKIRKSINKGTIDIKGNNGLTKIRNFKL